MNVASGGLWHGRLASSGHVGYFKCTHVEVLPETTTTTKLKNHSSRTAPRRPPYRQNPLFSVEELLARIGLKEYTCVFVLNGYENVDLFKDLEPADLDYLGILNADHRGKILTAVQLLHDMDCKL